MSRDPDKTSGLGDQLKKPVVDKAAAQPHVNQHSTAEIRPPDRPHSGLRRAKCSSLVANANEQRTPRLRRAVID